MSSQLWFYCSAQAKAGFNQPLNIDSIITNELCSLTCKINISIRQASSPELLNLINTSINQGIRLQAIRTKTDPYYYSFKIDRRLLRTSIIKKANEKEEEIFKKLKQIGFVSAALDNGTIGHRHLLFICLANPAAGLKPIYYSSETKKHYEIEDFCSFGIQLYKDLNVHGINLVGIVGDNLRPQIGGLAPWKEASFQSKSNDPNLKSIRYVPCCCHVLNLVIVDLKKTIVYSQKYVKH